MASRILYFNPDEAAARTVTKGLEVAGIRVVTVYNEPGARAAIAKHGPDGDGTLVAVVADATAEPKTAAAVVDAAGGDGRAMGGIVIVRREIPYPFPASRRMPTLKAPFGVPALVRELGPIIDKFSKRAARLNQPPPRPVTSETVIGLAPPPPAPVAQSVDADTKPDPALPAEPPPPPDASHADAADQIRDHTPPGTPLPIASDHAAPLSPPAPEVLPDADTAVVTEPVPTPPHGSPVAAAPTPIASEAPTAALAEPVKWPELPKLMPPTAAARAPTQGVGPPPAADARVEPEAAAPAASATPTGETQPVSVVPVAPFAEGDTGSAPSVGPSERTGGSATRLMLPPRRAPIVLGIATAAIVAGAGVWALTEAPPPKPATRVIEAPAPEPESPLDLEPSLRALALVNDRDLARARPFTERHALLEQLARSQDRSRVDRKLNLALDLLQARDSPTPCATFRDALERMAAAPDTYFHTALLHAEPPPQCPDLDARREAVMSAMSVPDPSSDDAEPQ